MRELTKIKLTIDGKETSFSGAMTEDTVVDPGPVDPDPVDPTPVDPSRPTRYIGPKATGNGSGSGPDNQATLADLDKLIGQVGPGGQVLLARHQGDYQQPTPLPRLTNSGADGKFVSVIGVGADLKPATEGGAIVGSRGGNWEPWAKQPDDIRELAGTESKPGLLKDASSWGGNSLLDLGGCHHLEFRSLLVKRFGNTIGASGARFIRLEDFEWENVRNGVYSDSTSAASDWELIRTTARGFSKEILRYRGKCKAFYVEDPQWDSMAQDLDDHARGLFATDYANGLKMKGSVNRPGFVRNCILSKKDSNYFRQGDLLTTETGNFDFTIEDMHLSGCSDRAIDMKSNRTFLNRLTVVNCKRSIGVWGGNDGTPVEINDLVSIDPIDIFELVDNGSEVKFVRHIWFGSWGTRKSVTNIKGGKLVGGYPGMAVMEGYSRGPGGIVNISGLDVSGVPKTDKMTGGSTFQFNGI